MNRFDADELLQTARQCNGLSDFGPSDFLEPFRLLVEAFNSEAGIAADRSDRLRQRLQRLLMNRLWFARDLADHPEILEEDLGAPIVISTLPRTGSTKLHRLLAASGDFQTLPLWKAHMPSRIPGEPDGGSARRIAETREHERWMYATSPAILTGHPQFTEEAEEDQWLMEASFRHPILFGMFDSATYLQWIMQADQRPAFDYFLTQLKYLQWQSPADRGKPWLLKSPTHFGNEHQLQRIFGALRVVVTHRDPATCMSSITATSMAVRRLYSDRDSSAAMAANVTGMFAYVAGEHMRWRDANRQVPVIDIGFREVSSDGIAAARKVYGFLGIKMSVEAERRMRRWEADNGRDKHGKSVYSAEAYGTSDAAIQQAFSGYIERFADYLGGLSRL